MLEFPQSVRRQRSLRFAPGRHPDRRNRPDRQYAAPNISEPVIDHDTGVHTLKITSDFTGGVNELHVLTPKG